ncbi:odorant receptor 43a-like [Aricia agestis]|uniref:odorant receptor 43a-like n=1 Tax=Aricia agestis TaxID=91739 RepID=UPI001C2017B3|nr:odorant receptor 43a-like [Aricia agestis]
MTKSNANIFLKRPETVLKYLGLWLLPTKYVVLHTIYTIFIMFTQYSFIVLEVIYIVVVWGDLEEVSEASYLLFTQASVCYKTTVFIFTRSNLKRLLDFMDTEMFSSQSAAHDRILHTEAGKIKRLTAIFLTSATTTCTLWAIMPLFDSAEIRHFPFKIWMPVDTQKSPHYEVGYFYQVSSIYISAFLFFAVDSTTLSMIIFGRAQLKIVIDKIKQLQSVPIVDKSQEKQQKWLNNNKLFNECISQHQLVIRFIQILEDTYHANIFFQLSGSAMIICIIGLRITIAEPSGVQFYSMITYMGTMLSQLLLYCWCGHELTSTSEELRMWLYQSPWHEQDAKFRRTLIIAMERMKKPIIFKAGHYIPLSRPTFVSILRSSYSYFAVLNQANNK